jgi:molybdenum cofactor synthesis domain-containing protein
MITSRDATSRPLATLPADVDRVPRRSWTIAGPIPAREEPAVLEASMIVVGDEILGGYVTDTNSPLLARLLRDHGVVLRCVHVVGDDEAAIDEALTLELARSRPRLVVTSGGIGSTPDDLTFEAVAASLGRDLVIDPTIGAKVDGALAWSRTQGFDVTDRFAWHLFRMARIPAGSRLLERPGGWAPGVLVDVDGGLDADGATVVILPGVPSEFEALLTEAVVPALVEGRNPHPHVTELTHHYPESVLNLAFVEVMERYPDVKLGSYPGHPSIVRLSGPRSQVEAAADRIAEVLSQLDASEAGQRLAAVAAERAAERRTEHRRATTEEEA